ncbi:HPr family phosphocarrier protein [Thalassotalea eurytherma]|uniref:Phosphate ABC transporter permease n=1 Tax=Thalassotalea eurytherma TaxID=1144278 RepID=A0ABQ6H2H2_9GAMM|nr:HPr family phosphocarrier protein [Thalassotalea eurytherma]GLX81684.1 phosphate ABC transporter permease [Thalassotalea eurytherma]
MLERTVTIINKLGIHARPATKLAKLSSQFDANVQLCMGEKHVDASSIMGLMLLAGAQGKKVTVQSDGPQAQDALDAICQLIEDKFDEE